MERKTGFTIVELLIVIVVIAILATLSIVAFNGIQQRSRNAQTMSAVNTYEKALKMYYVDEGRYPPASTYGVCLGGGYPDDHCWIGDNGSYFVDPAFDAALSKYMSGNKPEVTPKYHAVGGADDRAGILYFPNNVQRQIIEYILEGPNQDCELPTLQPPRNTTGNTGTRCQYLLEPVS